MTENRCFPSFFFLPGKDSRQGSKNCTTNHVALHYCAETLLMRFVVHAGRLYDWIELPEERRRATRELNKGEAQNALKRAIFFHRTGRIRDHGLQAQGHRASALNLVASAIVLWNTTYLGAAMRHLERQGRSVAPDLLQHLSPLGWQHINLTGDYLWTDAGIPEGKLRPLRQAITITDNP
ncbi:hypothetical protein NBRC3188_3338 [Acetobacter pasteurianus NBRC 3188]|uniref:Tn3 transposase DDE domain-containing protein n=1 Tax=Acetobacter pasteurianus NBRC 3188 TaxID=1226663 RepID=A0A401WZ84_ACEPA|nr:hypothetical protein NBRC3188_3338 [Acetobacter pasteurianus NBRC 3188]